MPNIVSTMGYLFGLFPPGRTDAAERDRATETLVAGHRAAVAAVRAVAPGVTLPRG